MEIPFKDVAIGSLIMMVVDYRMRRAQTRDNVFVKVSAKRYRPVSGKFVGLARFPTMRVAVIG